MRILVISGPNLNMLGKRDPKHYGTTTLKDIEKMIKNYIDWDFTFFQSNYEGAIIDKIQESLEYDGIIINPGGLTHTSISIRDMLDIFPNVVVEVHLSDIYKRESFRKINLIKDVVDYSVIGQKEQGYLTAINYLKNHK